MSDSGSTLKTPPSNITSRKSFTKEDFRDRAFHDHVFFCQNLFPEAFYVPFAVDPPIAMHRQIFDLVNSNERFVGVIAPRKCGKTPIICFSYPIRQIVYNLETYIVIISETMAESKRHIQKIVRALEVSERIHYWYGNYVNRSFEVQKESVRLANGIWLRAKSYLSQIRGTSGDWTPPSLEIVDDPQSNKNVKTENSLTDAQNWFEDEVIYSLAQKWQHPKHTDYMGSGKLRFLGTSLHPNCLAELVYKDPRFKCLRFSILMNDAGEPDIANGKSVWEAMFSTKSLYREMRNAERAGRLPNWLQERMNMPYKYGQRAFDIASLRDWQVGGNKLDWISGLPFMIIEQDIGLDEPVQQFVSTGYQEITTEINNHLQEETVQ